MAGRGDTAISSTARRYTLALVTIAYVFNFIDRQILAILLPAIKAEFGVDDWVLGFLAGSAFALFYATLGIPIALLADRMNRRNLIAVALTVWSAMTALSGVAANVTQLALARIGVGIGEAGFGPPAHSIIADYFPPKDRATAMGVYSSGISIGILIAYLGGGWMVENFGWRRAFMVVGLPGLLLALIVRFTIKEPPRGLVEDRVDTGQKFGVTNVAKFLLQRKSFVHMSIGTGLSSFGAYAILSFFPSFLVRSHGMSLQEIGVYLGIIIGVSTGIGYIGGGKLADRIGKDNRSRSLQVVAAATMLGWVFVFPLYLLGNPYLVLAIFFLPSMLTNVYLPTAFALTQGLVSLRMRAVAAAILLFVLNIIGLGLGPQITGILSDYLAGAHGVESLRYSLLIVGAVTGPWAAWHFYVSSRHINADLERSAA